MPDLHPDYLAFNEAGKALQSLGFKCRIAFFPADDLVPRDQWMVALDCPGVPFGEVYGIAGTAGDALMQASVKREDALALQARSAA